HEDALHDGDDRRRELGDRALLRVDDLLLESITLGLGELALLDLLAELSRRVLELEGPRLDELLELVAVLSELLFLRLARGHVLVRAEDSDDVTASVSQRDLVRVDPGLRTVTADERLEEVVAGLSRRHDLLIHGDERVGLRLRPRHLVVRPADD